MTPHFTRDNSSKWHLGQSVHILKCIKDTNDMLDRLWSWNEVSGRGPGDPGQLYWSRAIC